MPVSISNQVYIFLCSVVGGMLIAFIFDLFRIKRKSVHSSNIVTYIEDFIYWIIVALIMFLLVYYSNEGQVRGFIFIGVLLGVITYILLLSRIIMTVFLALIKAISIATIFLAKVLLYPIRIIIKIIMWPIKLLLRPIRKARAKASMLALHVRMGIKKMVNEKKEQQQRKRKLKLKRAKQKNSNVANI